MEADDDDPGQLVLTQLLVRPLLAVTGKIERFKQVMNLWL